MTINPWINFNGNAEEAFTLYASVLGGEITHITRFKDIATPEFPVAAQDADKLMRITLEIRGGHMLIGNDVPAFMGQVNERENRSKIYIQAENKEEAQRLCDGLSRGGTVEVPIEDGTETAFAMLRDMYGIEWIIEFDPHN